MERPLQGPFEVLSDARGGDGRTRRHWKDRLCETVPVTCAYEARLRSCRTTAQMHSDLRNAQFPCPPRTRAAVARIGQRIRGRPARPHRLVRDPVDERKAVAKLARRVQEGTGDSVELAYVEQDRTDSDPTAAVAEHGIALEVVRLDEAKEGFVLLPRRWVVERSFAWSSRLKRLAKDYERPLETLAGLHVLAFRTLMLGILASWTRGA